MLFRPGQRAEERHRGHAPRGTVTVRLQAGDPLRVCVRNPGRVAEEVVQRFFDKYVTAGKSGGTGLGTYSARLMARVQAGDLEMQTGRKERPSPSRCRRCAASHSRSPAAARGRPRRRRDPRRPLPISRRAAS